MSDLSGRMGRFAFIASLWASAHLKPSHPKAMMLSLHVLRCALRGRLLPWHLEQRLCRPVGASEQESVAM